MISGACRYSKLVGILIAKAEKRQNGFGYRVYFRGATKGFKACFRGRKDKDQEIPLIDLVLYTLSSFCLSRMPWCSGQPFVPNSKATGDPGGCPCLQSCQMAPKLRPKGVICRDGRHFSIAQFIGFTWYIRMPWLKDWKKYPPTTQVPPKSTGRPGARCRAKATGIACLMRTTF